MRIHGLRHSTQRGSTEILIGLAILTAAGILAFLFQYMATQRLKSSVNQLNALSGLYTGELAAVAGYLRCFPPKTCSDSATGYNPTNLINLSFYEGAVPLQGKVRTWASLFLESGSEAYAERGNDGPALYNTTRQYSKQRTLTPRYRPGTVGFQRSAKVGGKTVYCGVTKAPHTEERNCIEIKEPPVLNITVGGVTTRDNYLPGMANALQVRWTATNSTSCKVDAYSAPRATPNNRTPVPANSRASTAPLPGGNTYNSAAFPLPQTEYTFELSCVSDIPAIPPTVIATVRTGDYPPVTASMTVAAYNNPAASRATAPGNTPQRLTWTSSGATECRMKSTLSRYCPTAPDPTIDGCVSTEYDFSDSVVGSNSSGLVVATSRTNQNTAALPQSRKATYTLTCSNPQFSATASVFIQTYELVSVYRAYNPKAACHFFTDDLTEYNQVTSGRGYLPEGERFKVFKEPFRDRVHPIYRLYNTKCHYYTISGGEKDSLVASGAFSLERTMGYAYNAGSIPINAPLGTQPNPAPDPAIDKLALIYHLYNANSFGEGLSGNHIFVPSAGEAQDIITQSIPLPPKPPVPEWTRQNHLGFAIPVDATNPVYSKKPMYRFLLPSGYHFFTTNLAEGAPYIREANDFCVYADSINGNLVPLNRLNHPNGSHLLTPSRSTVDALTSPPDIWVYEGIEGYVFPGTVFSGQVVHRYYQTSNGDQLYSANGALGLPAPWRLEPDTFTGTIQAGGACP